MSIKTVLESVTWSEIFQQARKFWWKVLEKRRDPAKELRETHPYLYKSARTGPTDYVCEFAHADIDKARHSILWFGDWDEQTNQVVEVFQRLGVISDGARVLDYGCGIGRVTKALLDRYDVEMLSVDRAAAMREHARNYIDKKYWERGKVSVISDQELIARSGELAGRFDLIFMVEVLQHIPEPVLEPILLLLRSLLKPEGRFFVYGNEALDVDAQGRELTLPVKEVVGRHFGILQDDTWKFQPEVRYSLVCTSQGQAATS